MRNKRFELFKLESAGGIHYKSSDLGKLQGKFAARILFKYNYFNFLTGDISALEKFRNKWLPEKILSHTVANQDKSLVPVLIKISSGDSFTSDSRRHASEILKMTWVTKENSKSVTDLQSEEGRYENAKIILTGQRTPNTSDILRLLKDKSHESKKLGIYLIGKFRLTDMLSEVCVNLFVPGLESDTANILSTFGELAGSELRRLYLKSSGNAKAGNAILRLLGKAICKENSNFLFERLWSNIKETKETALNCLIDCDFKLPGEEAARFIQLITEVIGNIIWTLSAQVCLVKSGKEFLSETLDKEVEQWKRYLYGLLIIANGSEIFNYKKPVKNQYGNFLYRIIGIIFRNDISAEKKLRKLDNFFPVRIPEYKNLIDDLLNRDYNLISIWAKACTLNFTPEIEYEEFGESAVALIFSPEEILRQEAAKLVARSSKELYKSTTQRIPFSIKIHLDRIVNNESSERDLILTKTKFLSNLFPEVAEEKLLLLGKMVRYAERHDGISMNDSDGYILWIIQNISEQPAAVKIIIDNEGINHALKMPEKDTFIYTLPLTAIEEFHFVYPEYSYPILKYIDDNEYSN